MYVGFCLLITAQVTLKYPRHIDKEYMVGSNNLIEQGDIILAQSACNLPKGKLYSLGGGRQIDNKKTWLDIGCGHGEFIEAVESYFNGVSVKGTEPNVHKAESARKRGLNVSYFDIESHEQKYEVVSMLNVYSHLPHPPVFLKSLVNILEPDGELILETGDTAGFPACDHYRPFCLPDHLSFASEGIVVGLLERQGFEILSVKKYPFMRGNLSDIFRELIKAILPQYRYKSRLKYCFKRSKYSQTDMFIRARLKSLACGRH